MDRTICAKQRSRHRGFSASRSPGRCVTFPGQARRARTAPAPKARSRLAGRPLTRFHTWPRACGVSEEPDVFSFHENSLAGGCPGPPERHFRAPRGGRPAWSVPCMPQAERKSRMISVRAGLDRRTGLPDLLRALRPPVLPVSGAGGARPSDRAVWTGFVPSPFRPGWGGDLTPAGGTDGVRAGGRGDRRRSGGNADQVARRSLRADSAAKPTGIDRR